jgi:hypothetical protein
MPYRHDTAVVRQAPPPPDPEQRPELGLIRVGPWDLLEPGFAAYRGHRFPVRGAARRLLVRLVQARGRAAHAVDLKAALGNPDMDDVTLRRHVHDLRRAIRAGLKGWARPKDPAPRVDAKAWLLAVW